MAPDHALEELSRFGHHESQAIKVNQHLEQLGALEMLDSFGQITALPQGRHEILARLCATCRNCVMVFSHGSAPGWSIT